VFVNEEGEFFWKEKTAEKVWVTNRKEQNLEPLKYEEVSIESLGGPAPAETTEPEGEKPEGEKEVTETTEPEGEKPEGEKEVTETTEPEGEKPEGEKAPEA
jgi:hypothetical protein